MRTHPCHLILVVLILASLLVGPAFAADDTKQPNLVIFVADDMAWNDCGAYGHKSIRTPNIDALAAEGMRFDAAFLTTSSCSPCRCSVLTGRWPHNTGAEQLHWPLPKSRVMVSKLLRDAGYWTLAAGKWHLGNAVKGQFDKIVGLNKDAWVASLRDRPKDKPFFAWLAFSDPHRGYQKNTIPKPHTAADAVVPPFLPDVPETRRDLAMYYDEIGRLDGVVGRVMAELRRQGIADETFVLFFSDNGRPFPRCKTTLYDSGIKTPLIVRFPGRVKPGTTNANLLSTVDIAPTLLELAGAPPSKTFQGKSFAGLLTGDADKKTRNYIYAEHNWHDYSACERAVRGERYKYIRNFYPQFAGTPPADAVRSPTYIAMRRLRDAGELPPEQMGCFIKPRPEEELYDLKKDPYELKNLVTDPAYAKVLGKLRSVLTAWREDTHDIVPKIRAVDEFHRELGSRLKGIKFNRTQRAETLAEER